MPYIVPIIRSDVRDGTLWPRNAGELNYLLTTLIIDERLTHETIQEAVDRFLWAQETVNYQAYNDVMGAVIGAGQEAHRRGVGNGWGIHHTLVGWLEDWYDAVVGPYEDTKIAENGDVYPSA